MSRECKAGTPAQNFTDLSRNHQEALHRKRFLERKKDANENDASISRDLPVYEPKEREETPAKPVYGWKHGQHIRHRKLDNQPRDQMTRLIKLTDAQVENSSAVSTPASHGPRRRHFKV